MKHLVIGDCHVKPDHSIIRFKWLAKQIADQKPTHIIQIGDWADMESLSSYDKGKTGHEGRRYTKDVDSVNESIDYLDTEVRKTAWGKKKWSRTKKYVCLGNHEQRIERAMEFSPELEGIIGYKDFAWKQFGWDVRPFLETLEIGGIHYIHYLPNKMGRAIASIHHANNLLLKYGASITVGHSHEVDFKVKSFPSGLKMNGLVCGSFLAKGQKESYAGINQESWWRGIVIKNNVVDGMYDPHFISY